jgi:hypothetical protein
MIIPAINAELQFAILGASSGGCEDLINVSANDMFTVLYAAEKLEIIERRTSATAEFRFGGEWRL